MPKYGSVSQVLLQLVVALVFILLVSQPDYSRTSLGTSLFKRQFHSKDTKFYPRKLFTLSFYLLPLLKGHLYSGKRDTSSGSQKPGLTSIQGTP